MTGLTEHFYKLGNEVPINAKFADAKPGLIGGDSEDKVKRYRQLLSMAEEYNRLAGDEAHMEIVVVGTNIRIVTTLKGGQP